MNFLHFRRIKFRRPSNGWLPRTGQRPTLENPFQPFQLVPETSRSDEYNNNLIKYSKMFLRYVRRRVCVIFCPFLGSSTDQSFNLKHPQSWYCAFWSFIFQLYSIFSRFCPDSAKVRENSAKSSDFCEWECRGGSENFSGSLGKFSNRVKLSKPNL